MPSASFSDLLGEFLVVLRGFADLHLNWQEQVFLYLATFGQRGDFHLYRHLLLESGTRFLLTNGIPY